MYIPFDKVIFRFPRFPIEVIKRALADTDYFKKTISTSIFKEAIFYASPTLHTELLKFLDGSLPAKKEKRVSCSLIRYLSRMSTRCTPFAIFAACATGCTGESTHIELDNETHISARLDMLYLCMLSQQLCKKKEIKKKLQYLVNSSLYRVSDKIRYIEYQYNIQKRNYHLSEVKRTPYIDFIIREACYGITINSLTEKFIARYEVDREDVVCFIESLIDNQILVSEIEPIIAGDDFFRYLLSVLAKIDEEDETYQTLSEVEQNLSLFNSEKKDNITLCNAIEENIKKLGIPYQKKNLLQIDSFRLIKKAVVGQDIIEQLQDYMQLLSRVVPYYENELLHKFKGYFRQRYEEQEIPLPEVLDPELGIRYLPKTSDPSPFIAGLNLPVNEQQQRQMYTTPLGKILQKKMFSSQYQEKGVIELTKDDFKGMEPNWNHLPPTLAAKFSLLCEETRTILCHINFCGNSAANLLGRFAYCDSNIHSLIKEITRIEQQSYPDFIVAEIIHVPDTRVGNILARPHFRDYEIVYLANTTPSSTKVIYPDDILVSVRNNEILLRSRTLNKYIVPRLSTAHNFNLNPTPIYKFLCDLQSQGVRPALQFSWGELEAQFDYLPRVVYQNILCSFAQWRFQANAFAPLVENQDSTQLLTATIKLRERYKLPRYVNLIDGDNKLFVDLENLHSLRAFITVLPNRKQLLLEEAGIGNSPVVDKENCTYSNECIVSFFNSKIGIV